VTGKENNHTIKKQFFKPPDFGENQGNSVMVQGSGDQPDQSDRSNFAQSSTLEPTFLSRLRHQIQRADGGTGQPAHDVRVDQ